jgi:hypothetical protein
MDDVVKGFYRDVVGFLDYLDGVVSGEVSEVEERRVGVFNLLFMLILMKMLVDFRLVSGEQVGRVLSERELGSFLSGVDVVLGRHIEVGFLRLGLERFLGCNGLVEALRRVYEYGVGRGRRGLKFYDLGELGSDVLGGVYERFLSWLSEKDKKAMGAYYTPKLIVKYMCQESLFYYLASKLEGKVSEDGLRRFVVDGDVSGVEGYEREVNRLLAEVRICDPACGAGDFLVGMLDEIVRLRRLVSVVSEFGLRRHAIENSLYGIDIDGRVVEVCKLRLWFSLVGSGDVVSFQELRFNVVQGDALLDFPREWVE